MRDLPELESVTTGNAVTRAVTILGLVVVSVVLGALAAGAIWLLVNLFTRQSMPLLYGIVIGLAAATTAAAFMARDKTFDWKWTIDSDGITIHGLYRTRHIGWSEITSAEGKPRSNSYNLRTATSQFAIADMMQSQGEVIGASLYQHLRRYGKADESLLTPGARTFWIPIPDEVPKEMDWHHPNPPNWSILMGATIAIMIAVPIAYFLGSRFKFGDLFGWVQHWAVPLALWAYKKLRDRLIVARSLSIRGDHIEMRTARSMLYLNWRDINYVHWDNTHKSITLGKGQFTSVAVIPYLENDRDSAASILAILRQLRLAHHTPPVPIPTLLLPKLYEGASAPITMYPGDEAAEIKLNNGLAGAVPVLLTILPLGFIAWLMSDIKRLMETDWLPKALLAPVVGLALGVAVVFLMRTTYRADANGITIKTLLKSRFIDWREITAYTVASSSGAKSKRMLTDSAGQVVLTTPYLDETQPHIERFTALLDARLAHVRQHHLPTLIR